MKFIQTILVLLLSVTFAKAQVSVFAKVDHVKPDGVDTVGGIALTVSGSTAPYTYTWNPGAINTKDITNKTAGQYTLNVTSASSQTYTNTYKIGYKVQWQTNSSTTFRNDSLTTSHPSGTAYSKNTLAASTDGWFEYVFNSLPGTHHSIGFLDSIAPAFVSTDIDYGVYFEGVGQDLYALQTGVSNVLIKSNVKIGDVVRVERVSNTIKYFVNNSAVRTVTISGVSSKVLKLKASLLGATKLNDVGCSFMGFNNQTFQNYVGLKPFIKHSSDYGISDGSIAVTPRISFSNTYTWSPGGATSNSVTSRGYGINKVTVTDSLLNVSSHYYNVGYKVKWTNMDLCSMVGDSLVSTATSNIIATANSKNVLKSGENGWVEFPIDKITGETYYIGFSDSLSPLMGNVKDIDYGINFNSINNYLYYYEGGTTAVLYYNPIPGDLVRLERSGNTIYYKINNVAVRTVTLSGLSSKNLKVKTAIQNADYLARVGCSFYDKDSTNFSNYVQISKILVKHSSGTGINDGFVSVSPKLAGAYTYTWLPGSASTTSISALSNGIYTVTVKDSLANTSTYTSNIGYKVKWTNLNTCFFRNDTIKGTGASNAFNGNAYSKNILSANTNGWIEFVLKAYPANATWLGFTDSTSTSVTTLTEMDYGIIIPASSKSLNYYESGTQNPFYSYMRIGDVIRIERSGNSILYKVNGATIRTVTSGTISAKVMKAKVRLQYNNEIVNVGCSFVPCTFTMSAGSTQTITCTNPSALLTGTTNLSGASYTWSPGSITTSTASVTSPGTYTLAVSSSSGQCVGQSTVTVLSPLSAVPTTTDYVNTTAKGQIQFCIKGGSPPYNVAWNGLKLPSAMAVYHFINDSIPGGIVDSTAFKSYVDSLKQKTLFTDLEPGTYPVTIYDQNNDSIAFKISLGKFINPWTPSSGVTTSTNTINGLTLSNINYQYGIGQSVAQQGTFSAGGSYATLSGEIDLSKVNEISFVMSNTTSIAYAGIQNKDSLLTGDTTFISRGSMFRFNGNGTYEVILKSQVIFTGSFSAGDHFALRTNQTSGKISYYKNEVWVVEGNLSLINSGSPQFLGRIILGNTGAVVAGIKTKTPILTPPPVLYSPCKLIGFFYPVTVSANPNPVCAGNNLSLTGQLTNLFGASITATSYLWQPISNSSSSPAPFSVSASQVYTLSVTYSGCVLKKTIAVTVISVVADAGSDQPITGSPLSIGVPSPVSPGTPPFSYSWLPNTDFVVSGGNLTANPSVNPSSTVIYTLRVTDSNGCYADDMVTLYTIPISYASLRKSVDGGFYEVGSDNKVYFKYTGQYNTNALNYKIYNPDRSLVTGCSINTTTKNYGDNRFIIDVSSCLTAAGKYYLLEVTNEKNELFYLRFKY